MGASANAVNIALDYDGTYTKDPAMWDAFIRAATARGHSVHCVTMRYPSEPIEMPCPVIYTGRQAKQAFVTALGLVIHIWIDDMPYFIYEGAA